MMAEIPTPALLRQKASSEKRAILDGAQSVAQRLEMPTYVVGGAVRDLFLTGELQDLDLTVEGDGIEFARRLAHDLGGTIQIHERFLTAEISIGSDRVDVVTARSEIYPKPASLPIVKAGTLEEDLYRRDFTINAMAVAVWPASLDRLIDPYCGAVDLEEKALRTLHARSFFDDPTRILRGARLGSRLDLTFCAETFDLASVATINGAFAGLSPHRLRNELVSLLEDARPEASLQLLDGLGFHRVLERPGPFGKSDIETLIALIDLRAPSENILDRSLLITQWWLAYLMGLNLSEPAENRLALAKRIGLDEELAVVFGRLEERLTAVSQGLADPEIAPHSIGSLIESLSNEELAVLRVTASSTVFSVLDRWFTEWHSIHLTIDGNDLLEAGFDRGPEIGRALTATLEARRDGRITTAEELEFAMRRLKRGE